MIEEYDTLTRPDWKVFLELGSSRKGGPRGGEKSRGAASPTRGFPCILFSRGSFFSRSLSSSTHSIFSITWRAEHRGWAGLGAPHLPSVARPWRPGPSGPCLLLLLHGLLQRLHLLQLFLVPLQQCSLWLLSLVQEKQLLLSIILLVWGREEDRRERGGTGCYSWPRGSAPLDSSAESCAARLPPRGPSPFCSLTLLCTPSPQLPSLGSPCPLSPKPSSPESAHSAEAAPCPSVASCPAHSAAVSASWTLVGVQGELAQAGGASQLISYSWWVGAGMFQPWDLRQDWILRFPLWRGPSQLLPGSVQ